LVKLLLQTTKPSEVAWPLYEQAATRIANQRQLGLSSPASSNLIYDNHPPFPPEWHRLAKRSYENNTLALALVRRTRSLTAAAWPAATDDGATYRKCLNACRAISNEVVDAALYEHLQAHELRT
jgi:hypothetical protein